MQVIRSAVFMLSILGVIAELACHAAPAPSSVPTPEPQTVYAVGYRDWEGLPEFSVFANGTTIVNATLDPGLTFSTLKPSVAKSLKVAADPSSVTFAFLNNHFTAPATASVNLGIGNGGVLPVNVGLINIMATLSPVMAHRPDAPAIWLGYPFLKQFQIRFNPSSHLIEFIPGTRKTKLKAGAMVVNFVKGSTAPAVSVTVPGAPPFTAIISVTSPVTVLPPQVVAKLAGRSPMQIPVKLPDGSETHVEGINVPSLEVGHAKVGDMQVLGGEAGGSATGIPTALLGMDYLQHFRFTIDFANSRLILEPITVKVISPSTNARSADAHDGFNPH